MEKKKPFYPVGGNVNWFSHYGEQYGSLRKTKNRTTITSSMEKAMATHYSVLARRISGMGESGRLPSLRSHRVEHD